MVHKIPIKEGKGKLEIGDDIETEMKYEGNF